MPSQLSYSISRPHSPSPPHGPSAACPAWHVTPSPMRTPQGCSPTVSPPAPPYAFHLSLSLPVDTWVFSLWGCVAACCVFLFTFPAQPRQPAKAMDALYPGCCSNLQLPGVKSTHTQLGAQQLSTLHASNQGKPQPQLRHDNTLSWLWLRAGLPKRAEGHLVPQAGRLRKGQI